MLERGSFGGVVTLSDVSNTGAVGVGELLARLLNCGFPMRSALDIVREHSFVGTQYIVVGDGGGALTEFEDDYPCVKHVERDGDGYRVWEVSYPPTNQATGSVRLPDLGPESGIELAIGESSAYRIDELALGEDVLTQPPFVVDGELSWSADVAGF
jgi:hypothetical protein